MILAFLTLLLTSVYRRWRLTQGHAIGQAGNYRHWLLSDRFFTCDKSHSVWIETSRIWSRMTSSTRDGHGRRHVCLSMNDLFSSPRLGIASSLDYSTNSNGQPSKAIEILGIIVSPSAVSSLAEAYHDEVFSVGVLKRFERIAHGSGDRHACTPVGLQDQKMLCTKRLLKIFKAPWHQSPFFEFFNGWNPTIHMARHPIEYLYFYWTSWHQLFSSFFFSSFF